MKNDLIFEELYEQFLQEAEAFTSDHEEQQLWAEEQTNYHFWEKEP